MGRELKRKVVDGIVLRAARSGQMRKPVLVIAVTDGQPAGDEPGPMAVIDTIRYATSEVQRAYGTPNGIAFQFAQVGNDVRAREFLGKLDTDPTVGNMVDCTSNFEQEQQEMMQQTPPVELTPDLWMIKLLLGAVDPSYDSKDEQRSYRPSGAQQPVSYGGPPSGPPPSQYGQYPPPAGQYQSQGQHAPQGPPGSYGQGQAPGYNRPPPQPPYPQGGQGGYSGGPSGQPPYPPGGGGGYSAPPPPPRY